jgi:hypothetical protein
MESELVQSRLDWNRACFLDTIRGSAAARMVVGRQRHLRKGSLVTIKDCHGKIGGRVYVRVATNVRVHGCCCCSSVGVQKLRVQCCEPFHPRHVGVQWRTHMDRVQNGFTTRLSKHVNNLLMTGLPALCVLPTDTRVRVQSAWTSTLYPLATFQLVHLLATSHFFPPNLDVSSQNLFTDFAETPPWGNHGVRACSEPCTASIGIGLVSLIQSSAVPEWLSGANGTF